MHKTIFLFAQGSADKPKNAREMTALLLPAKKYGDAYLKVVKAVFGGDK